MVLYLDTKRNQRFYPKYNSAEAQNHPRNCADHPKKLAHCRPICGTHRAGNRFDIDQDIPGREQGSIESGLLEFFRRIEGKRISGKTDAQDLAGKI